MYIIWSKKYSLRDLENIVLYHMHTLIYVANDKSRPSVCQEKPQTPWSHLILNELKLKISYH